MKNFFNAENPVTRFLSCFFDLMYANALFIIFSLPIFTIGASLTALYKVIFKLHSKEGTFIHKTFLESFKSNFKQSTTIFIPLMLAISFLSADIYVIYAKLDSSYMILQYPIWFLIAVVLSIAIYVFPLIACFENSAKTHLKNSILIALGNFPTTVFFVVVIFLLLYIASQSGKNMVMLGSIFLFFGFAAICFFYGLFLTRIFTNIIERGRN